jgi:hypothetical protein
LLKNSCHIITSQFLNFSLIVPFENPYLVQTFLASRGMQCLIRLSVWKMGLVSRMFEEGMGDIKTRT